MVLHMKVGLISLGCPKNLVDSEVMLGLARQAGHELTQDASQAEVLVVNTCAFIDSAKQESMNTILEMARHKKDGACQRLIVTGCLAERYREELKAEMPEIDAVLGTGEVPEIVRAIAGPASTCRRSLFTVALGPHPQRELTPMPSPRLRMAAARHATPRGCRRARHGRSAPDLHLRRRYPAISRDAKALRLREDRRGVRLQVRVLHHSDAARPLPQPAGRIDRAGGAGARRPRRQGTAAHLAGHDVLRHRSTGARRPRPAAARAQRRSTASNGSACSTCIPRRSTTRRSRRWRSATRSASTSTCRSSTRRTQVLKRMKRPGTRQHYDRLLARIRERVPGVALRTTFIVGFPGETDEDVDELQRIRDRPRVRPRRRVHLFPRRRHLGPRPRGRRAGASQDSAAQPD